MAHGGCHTPDIFEIFGNFCGEAILTLNVKPRALERSDQGNY